MSDFIPKVSIIMPCRNEVGYIEACLKSILAQEDLPEGQSFEVVIADGMSEDGTRDKILALAAGDNRIRMLDNHGRIIPSGLNLAIKGSRGDVIIRMDAHTEYAPDYMRRCLETLETTDAANVGGPARTKSKGFMQRAISIAYHSSFAVGGSKFHSPNYEGYTDTVTYGCWRKQTLEELGLFDEELPVNEDDELNFRMTRRGMKIWQSLKIVSWYYPRSSLKDLFWQYFLYGYWKVRVIRKHRIPASTRHVVPALFLGSVLVLGMLTLFDVRFGLAMSGCLIAYFGVSLAASVKACKEKENRRYLSVMPLVFAAYHFGYGCGFLCGILDFLALRHGRQAGKYHRFSRSEKVLSDDLRFAEQVFPSNPFISLVIPCRNEIEYIEDCLNSVLLQEEPENARGFEVLIADGMSGDGTREVVKEIAARDPRVRIVDNPKRIVSTALNLAIKEAQGDIILRLDAHAEYAPDYVKMCVETLRTTGSHNVGGPARTKAKTYFQTANSMAYHSWFSVGGAKFHNEDYEGYVDTVVYGCWLKRTLEHIGPFDENLIRNQDDEYNLRTIRLGGRVWQSPAIRSWYYPRDSLKALFRQYYEYGYWKVRVIRKHHIPASARHLVPVTFLAVLLVLGTLSLFQESARWLFAAALTSYAVANLSATVLICHSKSNLRYLPVMPIILGAYHFGYASGFFVGVAHLLLGAVTQRDERHETR